MGRGEDALNDLTKAIEFEPNAENPLTQHAAVLVNAMMTAAEEQGDPPAAEEPGDTCYAASSGARSSAVLSPGDEIRGVEQADVFTAVTEVAGTIQKLTEEEVRPLVVTLNRSV